MFPLQRGRRLRVNESIRSLVRETTLSPSDFMFPMFIAEGENYKTEIPSMPRIFRRSIDLTVEEWMSWRIKRAVKETHDVPQDLPYLYAFVAHCAIVQAAPDR